MAPRLDPQYLDAAAPAATRARRLGVDALLELARHLPVADRALVEAVLRRGSTVAEVARLTGRDRRALARRLKAVLQRLRHPHYRFLHVCADALPADTAAVARLLVFRHASLRAAARDSDLSLHHVRRHCQTFRAAFDAASGGAPDSSRPAPGSWPALDASAPHRRKARPLALMPSA